MKELNLPEQLLPFSTAVRTDEWLLSAAADAEAEQDPPPPPPEEEQEAPERQPPEAELRDLLLDIDLQGDEPAETPQQEAARRKQPKKKHKDKGKSKSRSEKKAASRAASASSAAEARCVALVAMLNDSLDDSLRSLSRVSQPSLFVFAVDCGQLLRPPLSPAAAPELTRASSVKAGEQKLHKAAPAPIDRSASVARIEVEMGLVAGTDYEADAATAAGARPGSLSTTFTAFKRQLAAAMAAQAVTGDVTVVVLLRGLAALAADPLFDEQFSGDDATSPLQRVKQRLDPAGSAAAAGDDVVTAMRARSSRFLVEVLDADAPGFDLYTSLQTAFTVRDCLSLCSLADSVAGLAGAVSAPEARDAC